MLVHFGWYVARLVGGDIVMSYRGNIEIESKDGHYGSTTLRMVSIAKRKHG
jgi:hypothetical protein